MAVVHGGGGGVRSSVLLYTPLFVVQLIRSPFRVPMTLNPQKAACMFQI